MMRTQFLLLHLPDRSTHDRARQSKPQQFRFRPFRDVVGFRQICIIAAIKWAHTRGTFTCGYSIYVGRSTECRGLCHYR